MKYTDLISHYETQEKAAKALGVAQTTISYWRRVGIPIASQIHIEVKSSGKLRANLPKQIRASV